MSFDNDYQNRKDHRGPYFKSKRFDRTCRPGGSCGWCQGNRHHNNNRRLAAADQQVEEFKRESHEVQDSADR